MKSNDLPDYPGGPVVKNPSASAGDGCHNHSSWCALEPVLCSERRHRNEEQPLIAATREIKQ